MNKALAEIDPSIEVISEPGRYYVEGAFTLAALLHSTKEITDGKNVQQMYYINDGCYGSFIEEMLELKSRPPASLYEKVRTQKEIIKFFTKPIVLNFFSNFYAIFFPLYQAESEETFFSTIWGPTCDSHDCIIKDMLLPKFSIGDWMVWGNMGAYSISLACSFNGVPIPDVYSFIRESDLLVF